MQATTGRKRFCYGRLPTFWSKVGLKNKTLKLKQKLLMTLNDLKKMISTINERIDHMLSKISFS